MSTIDPEVLAVAADGLTQLLEMATGHRQKCEAAGFSPTAAEHMAVVLHDHLITLSMST